MSATTTLAAALVALVSWGVLTFIVGLPSGGGHLLLGLGSSLLVRWVALRL